MPFSTADSPKISNLNRLKHDELLGLRIKDLPLHVSGMDGHVKKLYRDLRRVGLKNFKPKVYLGDEWFCPFGAASISVPFYLAHPRLTRLEKKYGKRVEGEAPTDFMKLLRHEAGHAFDHAYGISESRGWQDVFGDKDLPYNTERYKADPFSRDFVQHLPDHYAQCHPEEDFAETFAIFITPGCQWRKRYQSYPKILKKLRYIEALVKRCQSVAPAQESIEATQTFSAHRLRRTLTNHYGI